MSQYKFLLLETVLLYYKMTLLECVHFPRPTEAPVGHSALNAQDSKKTSSLHPLCHYMGLNTKYIRKMCLPRLTAPIEIVSCHTRLPPLRHAYWMCTHVDLLNPITSL